MWYKSTSSSSHSSCWKEWENCSETFLRMLERASEGWAYCNQDINGELREVTEVIALMEMSFGSADRECLAMRDIVMLWMGSFIGKLRKMLYRNDCFCSFQFFFFIEHMVFIILFIYWFFPFIFSSWKLLNKGVEDCGKYFSGKYFISLKYIRMAVFRI